MQRGIFKLPYEKGSVTAPEWENATFLGGGGHWEVVHAPVCDPTYMWI